MSDAIEYCDDCPANVPCHMERKCLRPKCDNCGSPAVYRGYHWEAGAVYTCRDCAASHWADHTNMRKIWPPQSQHNAIAQATTPAPTNDDHGNKQ